MNARAIGLLLAGLGLWLSGPALAQTQTQPRPPAPDLLQGRNWAAGCTGCHASDWLSGREALFATLLDFKSGHRPATVMQQLTRGYDDGQLRAIADHFSSRPTP